MRSPTNLFIANLACADLLVNVLCLPFTLVGNIMSAWIMGWLICKTVTYLQGVSVSASINTLVAISVERCLAICYPLKWQMTSRVCRVVVAIIWIISLTITLPWAIFFRLQPINGRTDMQVCTELWPTEESGNVYFVLAHLVMCYLLPLTLISICYLLIWRRVCRRTLPGEGNGDHIIHRSKVKVIKMLLVVVVSFALSWLPLYVLVTRIKFGGPYRSNNEEHIIHAFYPVAQWLGASNSCVNPIFYAFFNRKFRLGFKAIITSRSCCTPLRYDSDFGSVKSSYSCRMNAAKNGSLLVTTRMAIAPTFGGNMPSPPPLGNNGPPPFEHQDSTSSAALLGGNNDSVGKSENNNCVNNISRSCRFRRPGEEAEHNVIKSSSVSLLSHLNATSV